MLRARARLVSVHAAFEAGHRGARLRSLRRLLAGQKLAHLHSQGRPQGSQGAVGQCSRHLNP